MKVTVYVVDRNTMKKKKQLKSENKTRIKVATSHADMTPAQLKKYGVCEHNQINIKL